MTRAWRIGLLAGLGVVAALAGFRLAPPAPHPSAYFDRQGPLVIAHQGGDGLRPSNTLAAFEHAVALGADVLEMDVHLTGDGALVVMHDATVDRTTDGSGALAALSLAEVRALDAGFHWPYQGEARPFRGRGLGVPTFDEVASAFPDHLLNVEIKPDSAIAGRAVCAALQHLHLTERVLVASFHAVTMAAFRDACPAVPTSAVEAEIRRFYLLYRLGLWRFARVPAAALQLPPVSGDIRLEDPGFIAAARRRGLHVDFWTVNDPADMQRLIDAGADGIITDRPDLLLALLGRADLQRQPLRRSG